MRKTLLHWAVLVVLAAMLGGQVTELFDHWDHTPQTGRDVDYTVVIVAACLGVVFAVANKLASTIRRLLTRAQPLEATNPPFSVFRSTAALPLATGPPNSSLSPLRI